MFRSIVWARLRSGAGRQQRLVLRRGDAHLRQYPRLKLRDLAQTCRPSHAPPIADLVRGQLASCDEVLRPSFVDPLILSDCVEPLENIIS